MDFIKNIVLRSPLSEEKGDVLQGLIEKGEITTEIAEIIGDLSCIGLGFNEALLVANKSQIKKVGKPYEVYWSYLKMVENEKVFGAVDLKDVLECREYGKDFYNLVEFEDGISDKTYVIRSVKFDKDNFDNMSKIYDKKKALDVLISESPKIIANAISTYVDRCIPNIVLEKFLQNLKNFNGIISSDDVPLLSIDSDGWLYFSDDDEFNNSDITIYISKSELNKKPIKSTKPDIFEFMDKDGNGLIKIRDLNISISNFEDLKVIARNDVDVDKVIAKAVSDIKAHWYKGE